MKATITVLLVICSFSAICQFNFSLGAAGFSNPNGQIIGSEEEVGFAFVLEPKFQINKSTRFGLASKIGIGNPMKSLLGDINFKLADPGIFYLGFGYGIMAYEKIDSSVGFFPGGGSSVNSSIENNCLCTKNRSAD